MCTLAQTNSNGPNPEVTTESAYHPVLAVSWNMVTSLSLSFPALVGRTYFATTRS